MSRLLRTIETKARFIISFCVIWLMVCGTIFVISSAKYPSGRSPFSQLVFLLVGLFAFLATSSINYEKLASYSWLLYFLALFLLIATIIRGRLRWIHIAGPFELQPYEFAKIAVVIFLATLLAKQRNLHNFGKTALFPLLALLPFIALLICQPHFGACVLLFTTFLVMLFLRGVKISHILCVLGIGLLLLSILLVSNPNRRQRITSLFENDPLGKSYQKNQALVAIGSGGPWGKGLGNSIMKLGFLPEAHTDFLFAIVAEELGFFLTCVFVLMPFGLFLLSSYIVSFSALSLLGVILGGGLASLFAIQFFINLTMVSTPYFPVVGLPLPFFAYGGSSLISSCLAAGILNNIARAREVKNRQ